MPRSSIQSWLRPEIPPGRLCRCEGHHCQLLDTPIDTVVRLVRLVDNRSKPPFWRRYTREIVYRLWMGNQRDRCATSRPTMAIHRPSPKPSRGYAQVINHYESKRSCAIRNEVSAFHHHFGCNGNGPLQFKSGAAPEARRLMLDEPDAASAGFRVDLRRRLTAQPGV